MKQRIKLAFKILFCKKYYFTDCERSWEDKITFKDCLDISATVLELVKDGNQQQPILNEAKQILCQKQ